MKLKFYLSRLTIIGSSGITQRYCLRRKELKKTITDHITWCNNERIQTKLNYLSLVKFCLKKLSENCCNLGGRFI